MVNKYDLEKFNTYYIEVIDCLENCINIYENYDKELILTIYKKYISIINVYLVKMKEIYKKIHDNYYDKKLKIYYNNKLSNIMFLQIDYVEKVLKELNNIIINL